MEQADGPAFRRPKRPTKNMELRNQTSRWLRTSKSVGPTVHLSNDRDDSQHPFGDQATAIWLSAAADTIVALGFASQPYDWFAFSRMMTMQARFTRNYASAHVGQAVSPTMMRSVRLVA
jgi:hypothetical protein